MNEAEQDVFRTDVVVVEQLGLVLSQDNDPAGPVSKPFEHSSSLLQGLAM